VFDLLGAGLFLVVEEMADLAFRFSHGWQEVVFFEGLAIAAGSVLFGLLSMQRPDQPTLAAES
jgi:hypothetical protein